MKNIPEEIKALRKSRNETQAEFAEALGVSVGAVRDWEQGRKSPDRRSKAAIEKSIKDMANWEEKNQ